jgi:hypothetical protein
MPSHVCLRCSLQPGQVGGPEPVQEITHGGEAVGANQEQMAGALTLLGDKTCPAQDPQVVRDDLLRNPELQGDLSDGQRPIANPRKDAAPGAVRQCL